MVAMTPKSFESEFRVGELGDGFRYLNCLLEFTTMVREG